MPAEPRLPPALAALIDAARSFASQAPSARVPLARLDGVVRPESVPSELRERVTAAIERARAATSEPLGAREVERQLAAAWGERPARVLDDVDLDDPVAVRPHAQTHRGVLDGEPVAVKVVRPRVVATTRADLALLDVLARPIAAAFPALDAGPLLGEVRERTMDELDLEHEGEIHRRVARGLRRVEGVEVAQVSDELTTHDVHVSAWLDGPTLAAAAPPQDAGAVARALVRVYLGAPRTLGMVLANPRANDVVLLRGGGVGLIGPGAARYVARERVDGWIAALEALRDRDVEAFAAALQESLALLPADAARTAYAHVGTVLGPLLLTGGPTSLDDAALAAAGDRAGPLVGEGVRVAARATPDPADLWPLRMLGQLAPALALLGASEDWLGLGIAALREGWR